MLIVPIEEASPGMKLAAPVMHPTHVDQVLLKQNYVLEATVIQRMRDLGLTTLFVDYPGLEDLDKHLAVHLSPARQTVYNQIKAAIHSNEKKAKPTVSYSDYYSSTRDLITTLLDQGQILFISI